ncbi:MAG: hypothetical protein ACYTEQ_26950 [Planctomycetota bacterium]|jgi:hypothetical protein
MARQLTPPVTVVQGDEAPDVYISLQQDSTGSPYNLTNRAAFAVIVESGRAPEAYIEKFPVEIIDAALGQLKLSWVRDLAASTSYLDDLNPNLRYTVQIFLGSINYPPINVTCVGTPDVEGGVDRGKYFSGEYAYTGAEQEGSPIYKYITEYGDEVYLSRSQYTSGAVGDQVWVITSYSPALWDTIKDDDKAQLDVADLSTQPIWNFYQTLAAAEEATYSLTPKLDVAFTAAPDYIIAPEYAGGKAATTGETFTYTAETPADVEASGTQTVLTLIPLVVKEAYRL